MVIVWLNGAFGCGKTTTAAELRSLIPSGRLFDPETVGYMLRPNLADHPVSDFQHCPLAGHSATAVPVTHADGRPAGDHQPRPGGLRPDPAARAARSGQAVRREITRRGGQKPCLRIVRGLFTALSDPAGVIAHRAGALGPARNAPGCAWQHGARVRGTQRANPVYAALRRSKLTAGRALRGIKTPW
jgi:hypothetical protein